MTGKSIIAAMLALSASFAVAGAITESGAKSLKASQTVTLSYSQEEGHYVAFFKSTLVRSRGYTVYTTDLPTNTTVSLTVYPKDKEDSDKDGPSADFTEIDELGGNIRQVLYSDDWYIDDETKSDSDPKKWVYYFEFIGDQAETFTVKFQSGVFIPQGREDNPLSVSPSATETTVSKELQIGGEYFIRSKLNAGTMYKFETAGGSEDMALSMEITPEEMDSSSESDEEEAESEYSIYDNPDFADDPYNEGYYIIPNETAYYIISILGTGVESNSVEGASFSFRHKKYNQVAVKDHKLAGTLSPGDSVECTAGYMADWRGRNAYDEIIDESLYSFTAAKGERYFAETSGAEVPLLMRIYDKKGNILSENGSLDGTSSDVRCAFEAAANDTYYLGVCEDLDDLIADAPSNTVVTLSLAKTSPLDGDPDEWDPSNDSPSGATPLEALPGASDSDPFADGAVNGPHRLSVTDWQDVFSLAARKGLVYRLGVEFADSSDTVALPLAIKVFMLSGTRETEIAYTEAIPGATATLSFAASANATYYVRVTPADTPGLDIPGYNVRAVAYSQDGSQLGILKVEAEGSEKGTFSIGSESVKYPCGSSVLLPAGKKTVKFQTVKGFAAIAARTVDIAAGTEPTVEKVRYVDTSDPKDDTAEGATAWSLRNTATSFDRTLWEDDREDNFVLSGTDGYYYDFALDNAGGDAVFSITNAETGVVCENVPSVSQINLPKTKAKYYLTVKHADEDAPAGGGYVLSGFFANVGTVKFAKTAVSVKENAASVALQVQRTAKDGYLRVRYGTVAGTAVPGEDYVAQNGVLEWESGDSKAKTITVKLIPDLVEHYEGNKTFSVMLKPVDEEEAEPVEGEYPVSIAADTCTVTVTEVSKAGVTVESAYAAKAPKMATVKTEDVPLETGTFYGVLEEEGGALTNGFPKFASVTFTASAANPAALSAKVSLAGKSYSFSAKGWDEQENEDEANKTFYNTLKIAKTVYTNTLTIAVKTGSTSVPGDWLAAGGEATLVMNVPDSNSKGAQEEISYSGKIFRNNAKVQEYLAAVTNFTGYYTVALVPDGVSPYDGIPSGNGYLTVTIDNKGTAKVAGMLADGSTKPSFSVAASAIFEDEEFGGDYVMEIPLFYAKSPQVLGGVLRIFKDQETGLATIYSSSVLRWNNDNKAATYDNEDGFAIEIIPAGGWFDTLKNLERHYLFCNLSVSTMAADEFPAELLSSGYAYSSNAEADGTGVNVAANVFSTAKRVLAKLGKIYDLEASVNAPNVQVKLARATGLATGSFSLWSENEDGTAMKEITGFKHYGVLLTTWDRYAPIPDETVTSGFAAASVKISDYNEDTRRTTTRNWTFSIPFCVMSEDPGETDPWAEDWGESED